MSKLTDGQKLLIKAEFDKCVKESEDIITENKKVLSDIAFYKWTLRGLFAILLGGSIAGVFLIPGQIDNFVASRVKAINDLVIANGDLQSGNYPAAFDNMNSFMNELGVRSGKPWDLSKLSDAQKRFFFLTLVGVFAYNGSYDPTALTEFRSKDRWRAMLAEPDFQLLFPSDNGGYSSSYNLNLYMGLAYMRYADSTADLEQAYHYLHFANNIDKAPGTTGGPVTGVGLLEGFVLALLGKKDEAAITVAADPILQYYTPFELTYGKASAGRLLGDFSNALLSRLWPKFSKSDLDTEVCALLKSSFVIEASSKVPELKDPGSQAAFIKAALNRYAQVQAAIKARQYEVVNDLLERRMQPNSLQSLLSRVAKLDIDHVAASLYSTTPTGDTSAVGIRFFSVSSPTDAVTKESCADLNPSAEKEEFWTFHKSNSQDQEWKISFFAPPIQ